jgi:two-component system nitrogen regulation sensor histidine kinase GlnL
MDLGCYDLLSTAVLLLDEQGRIQHVNVAAEELFDLSRRQLKGVRAPQLFTGLASMQGGSGKMSSCSAEAPLFRSA